MKNNIYKSIILLILINLFNSCQQAIEPIFNIDDVQVTLKLESYLGEPLNNIQVKYSLGNNFNESVNYYFGSGFTNSSGIVTQLMSIPTDGQYCSFKISVNNNPGIPNNYLNKTYTFKLSCKDSTYTIKLPIVINTNCNESLPDIVPKKITLCPKIKQMDSLIVGPICLNCDEDVSISYSELKDKLHSQIIVRDEKGTPYSSNSFTLTKGSCFSIVFIYNNKGEIIPLSSDKITVNITKNNITNKLVDIFYTTESVCTDCDCPDPIKISYPADTSYLELCLNESVERTISLNKISNLNTKCELRFKVDKNFTNWDIIELLSFNNDQFILGPNSSLSNIKLRFTGKKLVTINDTLRLKIESYNPEYNLVEACNGTLEIIVKLKVNSGSCQYDYSSPIFINGTKSPDSTIVLTAGIGLKRSEIIRIQNPSNCPLLITGYSISNKIDQGRPFDLQNLNGEKLAFPVIIPSKTTSSFLITFKPDPIDAYPPDGVRKNNMQENFTAKLKLITNSPNCDLEDITLRGKIMSKSTNWICIRTNKNGLQVGVTFRNDGALTNDTSKYFIYIDSYNNNNNTVRLKRTVTSDNKVYVNMLKTPDKSPVNDLANTVCDIATKNNSYCDLASKSNIDYLDVGVGDVIAFNYYYIDKEANNIITYCTIMVIERINIDPNGDIILCFYVCTGV